MLNASLSHIDQIEVQQDHITKALGTIEQNLSYFVNMSEGQIGDLANLLYISSSLTYVTTGMLDLLATFQDFKEGILKLRAGQIPVALIPGEVILDLIQHIIRVGLRPLFPGSANYLKLHYMSIRVHRLMNPTDFIISIPLLNDPDVTFNLFTMEPLPHPIDSSHVIEYVNLPKMLAMSSDRTYFLELDSLEHCRSYEDLYLCDVTEPLRKNLSQSCAAQLFQEVSEPASCQKVITNALRWPLIMPTSLGWHYATSYPITLSVSCPGKTWQEILPFGLGRIQIPNSCKLASQDLILPSTVDLYGKRLNTSQNIVPFNLSLNVIENQAITLLHQEPLLKDVLVAFGGKLSVNSLKMELKNVGKIRRWREINTLASHTGLVLATLAVLIWMTGMGCMIYVYRVCNQQAAQEAINSHRSSTSEPIEMHRV